MSQNDRITLFFTLLILAVGCSAHGQRLFPGVEGAFANDLYRIEDPHNNLRKTPLPTGSFGVNLRKELGIKSFLEIDVLGKTYWHGVNFKGENFYGSTTAFNALLIPVIFGYKLADIKRFRLVPSLGLTVGFNVDEYLASGAGWGTANVNGNIYEYYYEENDDVSRCFVMVVPGLAIERKLFNFFLLSIYSNRSFGFIKVNQLDVSYTVNNSNPVSAKIISYGDYWSVGLGIKYHIGRQND